MQESSWSLGSKHLWILASLVVGMGVVVFMGPKPASIFSFNSSSLPEYLRSRFPDDDGPRLDKLSANSDGLFMDEDDEPFNHKPERSEEGYKNGTRSGRPEKRYSDLEMVEADLVLARAAIREAIINGGNQTDDPDYVPNGPMYWNPQVFHRSYLEMEKRLKIFIYEEGEPPVFHFGPCKHTYAIEGIFMANIEVSRFRTFDHDKAHLFFLPFSVTMITQVIYVPESHEWNLMKNTASDYVNVIAQKHPYWNRTHGADHFMLACHDWGPEISFAIPNLYKNSIRALCNANTSEQFNASRDVSIPEIHLPGGGTRGMIGGPPPSKRPILVFYAGGVHGPIRPILLEHWENKSDPDVQIYRYLPKNVSYYGMMRKSRYCICPSGYEVASPRMVEGLYMGCVPVLIKDSYVIPFSDVLNWETFAVIVPVKDIPNLKTILTAIPMVKYVKMQRRGIQMRRHFEVNSPPKRYDVFHMILHSIWLRRLNVRLHEYQDS
ncbi:putative glycosyltransferase [Sesamum alatum]|uniref:Glycosyltransferase n=1 Tax=Sesamum alatum TaxID=300844 RepID=A0AAE1YMV0_9LAMI|nr:putative glycosyltransferase [Sesamum alatum]